jgi:crossover junction endodeoxyribonuclease RusA
MTITFIVPGEPQPKGSMKHGRGKKLVNDNPRTAPWMLEVAMRAREAMAGRPAFDGACRVDITYYLSRPNSHFTAAGALRDDAPTLCKVKPDRDKLNRAIGDALKMGGVLTDDSRDATGRSSKVWAAAGQEPGVIIIVEEVE